MARIAEVRGPADPIIAIWQGLQPEMANAFVALSETVYQHTKLGFRVAEAARIRIAHIIGCLLCQNFRVAADLSGLMARVGVADDANVSASRGPVPDEAFYAAVENWRESPLFSERERLAVEYAEKIAETPRALPGDDEFWSRLSGAFDDAEIADLTYSITTWIATGRFVHVLGIDGSCAVPVAVQAPAAMTI
jgi:alkylhydroperoxidase family enzyme